MVNPIEAKTKELFRSELRLHGDSDHVHVAATVVAPRDVSRSSTVVFAFPGGGYNRRYFDLRHPELVGPTQAEWHAMRGVIFVAFDPYGGGESTALDASECRLARTTEVFHAISKDVLARIRSGNLAEGLEPVRVARAVAIGHSLGGMQLIAQQGVYGTFDAVGILGFSAVHTVVPTAGGFLDPHSADEGDGDTWKASLGDKMRYAYHWEDVPAELVAEDMGVGFPERRAGPLPSWITRTFPPFAKICLQEGVVAREAASISVPIFLSSGERDVMRELRAEPLAYKASIRMYLYEIPNCAHMHNFSPNRRHLWEQIQIWLECI